MDTGIDNNEPWAKIETHAFSNINGYGVWYYIISTMIGDFHVVEYETNPGHGIERFIYDNDGERAERKYKSLCKLLIG